MYKTFVNLHLGQMIFFCRQYFLEEVFVRFYFLVEITAGKISITSRAGFSWCDALG